MSKFSFLTRQFIVVLLGPQIFFLCVHDRIQDRRMITKSSWIMFLKGELVVASVDTSVNVSVYHLSVEYRSKNID